MNPLRTGALTPFAKHGAPTLDRVTVESGGRAVDAATVVGVVDLIAEAHDVTPIPPLAPYTDMPVTPAWVAWRLVAHATEIVPWRTVADSRTALPPNSTYAEVYAAGTTQNHPPTPGLYRFQLAAQFDSTAHPDGSYRLDVEVADIRGNSSIGHLVLELANERAQT